MEKTIICTKTSCCNYEFRDSIYSSICMNCTDRKSKISGSLKRKKILFFSISALCILMITVSVFFLISKKENDYNNLKSFNIREKGKPNITTFENTPVNSIESSKPSPTPSSTNKIKPVEENVVKTEEMPLIEETPIIDEKTALPNEIIKTPTNLSKRRTELEANDINDENNYSVKYEIKSDWGTGASINVYINNVGENDINMWSVTWEFSGNQKIVNIWDATYKQNKKLVFIKYPHYNSTILAGNSIMFGLDISYSGINDKPKNIMLNYE